MASIQTALAFRTKTATISNSAVAISAAVWDWTAGDLASADRAVIGAGRWVYEGRGIMVL